MYVVTKRRCGCNKPFPLGSIVWNNSSIYIKFPRPQQKASNDKPPNIVNSTRHHHLIKSNEIILIFPKHYHGSNNMYLQLVS